MSITVNNVLDLSAGRILNHGTPHVVTLATAATVVNASNASFVTGKVRKRGNAAFTFPVGKGGHLRPVGMSAVPPAGGPVGPVVETFTRSAGDCAIGCPAHNYTTDVGTWTVTATGPNGPAANNWYISYSHSGPLNVCPIQPGTNPTLHIGPPAGGICMVADCGAVYDDGPSNITDLRVESPFLDFSGITVTGISYRVTHQGFTINDPNDRASLWVFDGTNWLYVFDLMGGAECATYSGGSPVITNALSNNPAGRIGIRWQNNGNGLRNSRSYAVDDINLMGSTALESYVAEYFHANPQTAYNNIVNPPLDHISQCEYWTLDREVGYHPRQVTLSWDAATSCGVTLPADLRVAHFNAMAATPSWFDRGNTGTTGDLNSGTVTSIPVSLFGPFTLSSVSAENPLPITLLAFTARRMGGDALLEWTTASEQDNAWFDVLWAGPEGDLEAMEWIGRVAGAGNSSVPTGYRFVDDRPGKQGIHYYRLRQVDSDGAFTYSPVEAVRFDGATLGAWVQPNPFADAPVVGLVAEADGVLEYRLFNAEGRSIAASSTAVQRGVVTFVPAEAARLAAGLYTLELRLGGERQVLRLMKQ
jgi:hypothetical protein